MQCRIHDIMDVKSYMHKRTHPCCRVVQLDSLNTNTLLFGAHISGPSLAAAPSSHCPALQRIMPHAQAAPAPAPSPKSCGQPQPHSPITQPGRGHRAGLWPQTPDAGKLSSPVCQWPSGGAEAASFQFFGVIINNRWNKSRAEAVLLISNRSHAGLMPRGWTRRVVHCCPCPWSGHNQRIFPHAWTFHCWGSEIQLPTLLDTEHNTHPVF